MKEMVDILVRKQDVYLYGVSLWLLYFDGVKLQQGQNVFFLFFVFFVCLYVLSFFLSLSF